MILILRLSRSSEVVYTYRTTTFIYWNDPRYTDSSRKVQTVLEQLPPLVWTLDDDNYEVQAYVVFLEVSDGQREYDSRKSSGP